MFWLLHAGRQSQLGLLSVSRPKQPPLLAKEKVAGVPPLETSNPVFRSQNQPEIGLVFAIPDWKACVLTTVVTDQPLGGILRFEEIGRMPPHG